MNKYSYLCRDLIEMYFFVMYLYYITSRVFIAGGVRKNVFCRCE